MNSKGTQPYIYIYPFSPKLPSHQAATEHWAEFPVLYSRSLLVIHFRYSRVYMSIPNPLTISSPILPPLATIIHSLRVCFFPSNLIFKNCLYIYTHTHIYIIFLFIIKNNNTNTHVPATWHKIKINASILASPICPSLVTPLSGTQWPACRSCSLELTHWHHLWPSPANLKMIIHKSHFSSLRSFTPCMSFLLPLLQMTANLMA